MIADGVNPVGPVAGAPVPATDKPEEILEAARALEGVFLTMLTEELFKGTEAFKSSPVYGDLATEQLADELGRAGGLGLADLLAEQLGGDDEQR